MRPEGWINDYRQGPPQEGVLSFFVFDDLSSSQACLCHYDSLYEALGAYRYLGTAHPEWTSALGGELNGGAIDFVHRRNGVDTLVHDHEKLENWAAHPGVQRAVKELSKQLHLEEPSLDQLKQQAKERAAEKNKERKIGGLYRPKGRGELER